MDDSSTVTFAQSIERIQQEKDLYARRTELEKRYKHDPIETNAPHVFNVNFTRHSQPMLPIELHQLGQYGHTQTIVRYDRSIQHLQATILSNDYTREMQISLIDANELEGKEGAISERIDLQEAVFHLPSFLGDSSGEGTVKIAGSIDLAGDSQVKALAAPYEPPRFGHVQVENSLVHFDGGSTH